MGRVVHLGALAPPTDPFDRFLYDDEVERAIERVLQKYGMRGADLEDGRQEVQKRALEWKTKVQASRPEEVPTTLQGTKAVCIVIAHRHGASEYRKKKRDERRLDKSKADALDEIAIRSSERFDVVDQKRLIELLREVVPDHQQELFEDLAADVPQPAMAEERGVTHKHVRKQIEKGRFTFRTAITGKRMAILLVSGAVTVWIAANLGGGVGAGYHGPEEPEPVWPADAAVSPVNPAEEARHRGFVLCDEEKWRECLDAFDEAERLDPGAEQVERVRATHERARQEVAKQAAVEGGAGAESGTSGDR